MPNDINAFVWHDGESNPPDFTGTLMPLPDFEMKELIEFTRNV